MRQGGSPLTTPSGTSATRMYQHPIFKGRGMSYYSSEPFTSSGFLGEMQEDIAEETVSDVSPTTSIRRFTQPQDQYAYHDQYGDDAGGSPDDGSGGGYATGYATTGAGPEVDDPQSQGYKGGSPFAVTPSSVVTAVLGKVAGVNTLPLTIAKKGFDLLFGPHPLEAEMNKLSKELDAKDLFDLNVPSFPPYTGPPNYGDVEGGAMGGLGGGAMGDPGMGDPGTEPGTGIGGGPSASPTTEEEDDSGMGKAPSEGYDAGWGDSSGGGPGGGGGSESTDDAEGMDDAEHGE